MGWMPLPSPPNIQVTLIVSKVVFNSVLCLCSDTSNVPLCFLWYFLPSSYKDLTCRTCMLSHFSCVQFFVTPWTVAHQAPLSMGFSRQKKWSGLPYLLPGDFPNPGVKPMSLTSPALAGGFFTTSTTWEVPSKKKKAIRCLEDFFFIIQIQHGRGETEWRRGGSRCRSQHGVGHTSQKSMQTMTRYLWGAAAGCTFLPGSRWSPVSATALWSTDSSLSLEGRAPYLQSPQVRKVVRGGESWGPVSPSVEPHRNGHLGEAGYNLAMSAWEGA